MIRGIGVDTVDISRFERQLERTPALRERLFAPAEQALPLASLAARFAAREALIKALGGSGELRWHDMAVARGEDRAPHFVGGPALTDALEARGADLVHLSMTHDAGTATAFVIVEASTLGAGPAEQTVEQVGQAGQPEQAESADQIERRENGATQS